MCFFIWEYDLQFGNFLLSLQNMRVINENN